MVKKKKKSFRSAGFFIVLALCLCGSIYLNWYFGDSEESGKTLGESILVDGSNVEEDPNEQYFINARIDRKAAYDTAVSELNSIINSNADSKSKASATEELTRLALSNNQQVKIEQLVVAKGYKDCIAFVDKNNTTVIVDCETLSSADANAIKDIVIRTTEQSASDVRILTVSPETNGNSTAI